MLVFTDGRNKPQIVAPMRAETKVIYSIQQEMKYFKIGKSQETSS